MTANVLNPILHAYKLRSIISDNFMTLSITVSEKKGGQNLISTTENRPYFPTGSEFLKNKNKISTSFHKTSFINVSKISTQPSLRNQSNTTENCHFFQVLPV